MQADCLTDLLGIQGFRVVQVERLRAEPGWHPVRVHLERTQAGHVCGECGRADLPGYDARWQDIQHLTLWDHHTFLRFRRYRVACPVCGIRTEALPFTEVHGPRVTRSLAALVAELCKVMTVKAVATLQALHSGTVREIDKRALTRVQAERPLDGLTVLGVDELSVGTGQRYWHLVSALEGPRGPEMLFVGNGRKSRSLAKFWRWFSVPRARLLTHVVMDMWKPFRESFLRHCPRIHVLYDKFHVIRHLLDAVNEVRKGEFKKAQGRFRGLLAGKKFILLARQAHVRGRAREALTELLAANAKLFKAHLLKESFAHLWSYRSRTWALKFFRGWTAQLKWSRLKPLQRFARMVEAHLDGILAYCERPVSLGFIESANLKARNVIRRAYGYRDDAYCKLKIIQACTPWMLEFQPWDAAHTFSS